jgi:hypothetical protein
MPGTTSGASSSSITDARPQPAALPHHEVLGREAEQAQLRRIVADADGGPRSVVPSGGEAGTRNTRMAANIASAAHLAGTVTLLFTDLVGSTELLERIGDDEAERLRRLHFGLLRDLLAARGGPEVKRMCPSERRADPTEIPAGVLRSARCLLAGRARAPRRCASADLRRPLDESGSSPSPNEHS